MSSMSSFARTALTIGVLLVCLVLAATWGWHTMTKPFPSLTEKTVCSETSIHKGETVTPEMVTVSVLNAGKRSGLASRTLTAFTDQGFHAGTSASVAKTAVANVQIWTDDPASPAVKLVASRLPGAKVVQKSVTEVGVVVVVGDKFGTVGTGKAQVTATTETTICSPLS
ncbi:LytR C-terminal domain-containing protein [Nocardioides sp.]|uniref:LytR C-terminal domain-containing protein n=1 Tax=Nocardioides sp. TaxID=35761 RepID=UPI002629D6DD|nr:LytR C-terminal domain-containing protein [Nocardioides sp.]